MENKKNWTKAIIEFIAIMFLLFANRFLVNHQYYIGSNIALLLLLYLTYTNEKMTKTAKIIVLASFTMLLILNVYKLLGL